MKFMPLVPFLLLLTFSSSAFGYIDPGTGSLWLQTIIALLAGMGVTVKIYWQRFKQFFFKIKPNSKKYDPKEESD